MAHRTNTPTVTKLVQVKPTSSLRQIAQSPERSVSCPSLHVNHEKIMTNLDILAGNRVYLHHLLPFTLQPCLDASLYLLQQIRDYGLKPEYLVEVQKIPESASDHDISFYNPLTTENSETLPSSGNSYGNVDMQVFVLPSELQLDAPSPSPSTFTAVPSSMSSSCVQIDRTKSSTHCGLMPSSMRPNITDSVQGCVDEPRSNAQHISGMATLHNLTTGGIAMSADASPCDTQSTQTPLGLSPQSLFTMNSNAADEVPQPLCTSSTPDPSMLVAAKPQPYTVFEHFQEPPVKQQAYRSPCPFCDDTFETQRYFVEHINAVHEKPVEYHCTHQTKGSGVCYTVFRLSEFRKHHTQIHGKSCNKYSCYKTIPKPQPKIVRGCWLCRAVFSSVEAWVKHHMQAHPNCVKSDLSFTKLIESLLTQPSIDFSSDQRIQSLKDELTDPSRELEWSQTDPVVQNLVKALETGNYNQQNLYQNSNLLHELMEILWSRAQSQISEPQSLMKRPAPSPPLHPIPIDSRVPRDRQHRSSRNLASQTSHATYEDAYKSDFAQATMDYMRPVRKQDPESSSNQAERGQRSQA